MQLQAAQLLETVVAPVRSRSGGATDSGGKAFWRILAEQGPARAEAVEPGKGGTSEDAPMENGEASSSAAHVPNHEPREEGSQAERDELTLAAAIEAGFQPLTIHTLNDQLLRVDASLSPERVRQADAGSRSQVPPANESAVGHGSGAQPRLDDPASVDPRHAGSREHASDRSKLQTHFTSGNGPAQQSDAASRDPVQEPSRSTEAQGAAVQPAAASRVAQSAVSAAAVSAGIPTSLKNTEGAIPKPAPPEPQATTPIAGVSGRKAGGDAHMSRWHAQKPGADAQRSASPQRTAAMIAAQATKGLAVALSRADGTVTLRLNPESLGFIRIKLEMGKGTVLARFEASTEQARQLLEQSSETLRASLEAKGWETSQVRVELLREVDPAAEMLRKLEQQVAMALEREAAQDATAGQEQWAGESGGDREHKQPSPAPSSHEGDDVPGSAATESIGGSAERPASIGLFSRIDTIV